MGVPKNSWFLREDPIKMDDLGVPPFMETTIWKPPYVKLNMQYASMQYASMRDGNINMGFAQILHDYPWITTRPDSKPAEKTAFFGRGKIHSGFPGSFQAFFCRSGVSVFFLANMGSILMAWVPPL